jgi:hypothetical protein
MTRASVYKAQYGLKKYNKSITEAPAFAWLVYFVVNLMLVLQPGANHGNACFHGSRFLGVPVAGYLFPLELHDCRQYTTFVD